MLTLELLFSTLNYIFFPFFYKSVLIEKHTEIPHSKSGVTP